LDVATADTLIRYLLKEVENTWRVKFGECKELVHKEGVEQMVMIVDLKGVKLKDLSNKQVNPPQPTSLGERGLQIAPD
jgi:hypothetical protein